MMIRFTRFTQHGNVQHQAEDVLDLHEELASQHIDDGNAVPHDDGPAEVPQYETAAFFPADTPSHRGRGAPGKSGKVKAKGK